MHGVGVEVVAEGNWVWAMLKHANVGTGTCVMVYLQSSTAEKVAAARRELEALVVGWGHAVAGTASATGTASRDPRGSDGGAEVIDPVAASALVLSIPSAALAVGDSADRGRMRRRAEELVHRANQLANQQITVRLVCDDRPVDLTTAGADQLLDLAADETGQQRPSDPSTPGAGPSG